MKNIFVDGMLETHRPCPKCGEWHENLKQSYCSSCHAAYMRDWRSRNPMTAIQRWKDKCRGYSLLLEKRGKITRPASCEWCGGDRPLERHHPDYNDPRRVDFICKQCHSTHHKNEVAAPETIAEGL